MTRKDTDKGGGGDEEQGSCSSRPSISEASWSDARKPSVSNDDNVLTPKQQQFPNEFEANEKSDEVDTKADCNRQPCFHTQMEDCLAQAIDVTDDKTCTESSTNKTDSVTFTAAIAGSSTSDTRLPTSLLFELPDPRRGSTSCVNDQMPAISKAQMKEFEEAFNLFDKDRDGSITKEELGRVMRGLGQFARTEELRTMLEEIDTDGDGNVSLVEFVKIVSNIGNASAAEQTNLSQEQQEEQELRDAFRVFDKHNRGYITASDLRAVLQCLGEDLSEEEIEDMIKEVDEDGDGRIDFYEFARSLVDPGTDEEEEEDDDDPPQSPPF
ncbi:hypothetical protein PV327_004659 [Microctonus hyperodae]|uniref:EF-hand domain-containing protein n=1 Tax=Microctonus hyperodae TaxID=165561 RepID=A0AA39KMW5_MICHY|nr:hypothetical protein PV327_004659 [Microctonus hyperodae]